MSTKEALGAWRRGVINHRGGGLISLWRQGGPEEEREAVGQTGRIASMKKRLF